MEERVVARLCDEINDLLLDVQRALLTSDDLSCTTWRVLNLSERPRIRVPQFGACGLVKDSPESMRCALSGIELEDEFYRVGDKVEQSELKDYYFPHSGLPFADSFGRRPAVKFVGWSSHHYIESNDQSCKSMAAFEQVDQWSLRRGQYLLDILLPGVVATRFDDLDEARRRVELTHPWVDFLILIAAGGHAQFDAPIWNVQLSSPNANFACDVEIWRQRRQLKEGGFGPTFTEEDIERIGDNPEEAFTVRKRLLRDTEKALKWVQRAIQSPKQSPVKPKLQPGKKRATGTERQVIEQAKFVASKFKGKGRFHRSAKWAYNNRKECVELCNYLFGESMTAIDWKHHADQIGNLVRRQ